MLNLKNIIVYVINNFLPYSRFLLNKKIKYFIDESHVLDQLYESSLNENVLQLAKLVLTYKDHFNHNKSFVIDYSLYKDLECCFNDLGIDISKLLDTINLWTRYSKTKCVNKKLPRSKNYSIPSRLMIVLKNPKRNAMPSKGDIFFN